MSCGKLTFALVLVIRRGEILSQDGSCWKMLLFAICGHFANLFILPRLLNLTWYYHLLSVATVNVMPLLSMVSAVCWFSFLACLSEVGKHYFICLSGMEIHEVPGCLESLKNWIYTEKYKRPLSATDGEGKDTICSLAAKRHSGHWCVLCPGQAPTGSLALRQPWKERTERHSLSSRAFLPWNMHFFCYLWHFLNLLLSVVFNWSYKTTLIIYL